MSDRDAWSVVALKATMSALIAFWLSLHESFQALIVLIIVDVMTGIYLAWRMRAISSNRMLRGGLRKSMMIVVVALVALLEYAVRDFAFLAQLPLAEFVATYFCLSELLSVLENLALLGAPVPMWLTRRLRVYYQQIEEHATLDKDSADQTRDG